MLFSIINQANLLKIKKIWIHLYYCLCENAIWNFIVRDKLTWIAATSLLNVNYLHIIKAVYCFIFFLLARLFKKFDTMHCCFIYSGISIIVNNDCSWFISCQFFTVSQLYTLWDAAQGEMLLEAAQKFKKMPHLQFKSFLQKESSTVPEGSHALTWENLP